MFLVAADAAGPFDSGVGILGAAERAGRRRRRRAAPRRPRAASSGSSRPGSAPARSWSETASRRRADRTKRRGSLAAPREATLTRRSEASPCERRRATAAPIDTKSARRAVGGAGALVHDRADEHQDPPRDRDRRAVRRLGPAGGGALAPAVRLLGPRVHRPRRVAAARCIERIVRAEARSFCHWSSFLIAEVDGEPAAGAVRLRQAVGHRGDACCSRRWRRRSTPIGWTELQAGAMNERILPFLTCIPEADEEDWVIEWVATRPAHRGKGLVKALLQEILARRCRARPRALADRRADRQHRGAARLRERGLPRRRREDVAAVRGHVRHPGHPAHAALTRQQRNPRSRRDEGLSRSTSAACCSPWSTRCRGHEVAYNRWYERDHFYAGCMVGPWLFAGSRWVATRELKDLRFPDDSPIAKPTRQGGLVRRDLLDPRGQARRAARVGQQAGALAVPERSRLQRAHARAHADVHARLGALPRRRSRCRCRSRSTTASPASRPSPCCATRGSRRRQLDDVAARQHPARRS